MTRTIIFAVGFYEIFFCVLACAWFNWTQKTINNDDNDNILQSHTPHMMDDYISQDEIFPKQLKSTRL